MVIIKKILKYYLYFTFILFIGRVSLFFIYFDRFKDVDNYLLTFLYGLRMDTILVSFILVLPTLLMCLCPKKLSSFVDIFLKVYFLSFLCLTIYIENATLPFFAQYDVRPNYLFVEYLEYPKEVFSTLIADYKLDFAVAFLMLGVFIYVYIKYAKENFKEVFAFSYAKRLALFIPIGLVLFIGIRSSFGHRPANNSDALFSDNRILNEITKNSIYSIGYAVYSNKKYSNKQIKRYGKMEIKEALKRFKKVLDIKDISRLEKSHFKTEKPKNLVIFLQESMGYQFVEAVGGEKGITPNLNALSKDGILFKNLYSNGTRSIRGIAGITAGNFSVPGKGVLKRNKSQSDFFTFSKILKPLGYETSFIYGGESRFDNMKSWFLGNGFDKVIEEKDFKNPSFVGTWGVSDDDLAKKANEEFTKMHKNHQKFASIMFSTSNHAPFDFPQEKIKLIKGVKVKSVKNAVKYADFAIGELIRLAKKDGYYKDTVFVILADHNVRVYGDDVIPVNMFQIPGLILGGGVKPLVYENVSTQPDVLATALDLMGLDLTYPIMGHSIFSDEKQNLSLMQFNDTYGLRIGDKVAVIEPDKKPQTFIYKNKKLIKTKDDMSLQKDAIAMITVLNYLYEKRLYK